MYRSRCFAPNRTVAGTKHAVSQAARCTKRSGDTVSSCRFLSKIDGFPQKMSGMPAPKYETVFSSFRRSIPLISCTRSFVSRIRHASVSCVRKPLTAEDKHGARAGRSSANTQKQRGVHADTVQSCNVVNRNHLTVCIFGSLACG